MVSIAAEKKHQELAVCSQCLLCDDFFMMVVDTIPPPQFFKGKPGAAALEDLLEALQTMHCGLAPVENPKPTRRSNHDHDDMLDAYIDMMPDAKPKKKEVVSKKKGKKGGSLGPLLGGWFSTFAASNGLCNGCHFLPCPTCAELSTGMAYGDYASLRGDDHPNVLTPCRFYLWGEAEEGEEEELAPLYLNLQQDRTAKPKWGLAQGLGPPSLELDKSRSSRLFKGSLRQFGITKPNYHKRMEKEETEIKPAAYKRMVETANHTITQAALAALTKAEKKAIKESGQDPDDPFCDVGSAPTPKPSAFMEQWWSLTPLFLSWGKVEGQMVTPPGAEGAEGAGGTSTGAYAPEPPQDKKGGTMAGSKKNKKMQQEMEGKGNGAGGKGKSKGKGKGKGKKR
jgi:hypothetical protein